MHLQPDDKVMGCWWGLLGERDIGSCACTATLSGHKSAVRCLSSLADQGFISGADDCTIQSMEMKESF